MLLWQILLEFHQSWELLAEWAASQCHSWLPQKDSNFSSHMKKPNNVNEVSFRYPVGDQEAHCSGMSKFKIRSKFSDSERKEYDTKHGNVQSIVE